MLNNSEQMSNFDLDNVMNSLPSASFPSCNCDSRKFDELSQKVDNLTAIVHDLSSMIRVLVGNRHLVASSSFASTSGILDCLYACLLYYFYLIILI